MEKRSQKPNKLDALLAHRPAQVVFGVLALVLAYVFISWAVDSGSLLDYAIAFLLLVLGLRELTLAIRRRK